MQLTKPRVKHIQRHLVALLSSGNRYQPLITIILRLVDLDDTPAELTDLIDLRATLSNDRTDHVIRDENLLGKWLTGKHWHSLLRLDRRRGLSRLMGPSTLVSSCSGGIVVDWCGGGGGGGLTVEVGNAVGVGRSALGSIGVLAERVRVSVLAVHGLRLIRYYLHSSGDRASRASGAGGIGGGGRAAVALGELFNKGISNVVSSDVDGVGDTGDDERALGGEGEGGAGRV